ncbi:MAG: 50S ribosomal protein L28 [Dehalococcoidia bacterium]|nr:50S ribosomal protein L28 [Dehalococcoidia bacterium]
MSGKCDVCEKIPQWGHNVSHSVRRTNRSFKPNVHKSTVLVDGQPLRLNICTQCMRTLQKTKGR